MSREEHTRAFLAYVAGMLGDVDAYFATNPPRTPAKTATAPGRST